MPEPPTARLDQAHDALRAWCHERPDLRDPSIVYGAFGTINAIVATLQHVIRLAAYSTVMATGTDSARSALDANAHVIFHGQAAVEALEDAYRAVAAAHEITSHLVFAVADNGTE